MSVIRLVFFAFDGKDRYAVLDERRRDVVLGRQRIARAEACACATGLESKGQVCGLGGDMGADHNANTVKRPLSVEPISYLPQYRHLSRRPVDSLPAFGGAAGIFGIERTRVGRGLSHQTDLLQLHG